VRRPAGPNRITSYGSEVPPSWPPPPRFVGFGPAFGCFLTGEELERLALAIRDAKRIALASDRHSLPICSGFFIPIPLGRSFQEPSSILPSGCGRGTGARCLPALAASVGIRPRSAAPVARIPRHYGPNRFRCLTLQPAQRRQFLAPERMHTGHAPWHAAHAACWSGCRCHFSATPPARWRAVSRPPAIILQPSSPACQSFEEARCFGRSKLHRSLVPPTGLSNVRRKAYDTPFS
jgi:hypothetical protein